MKNVEILIVDDEPDILELLEYNLSKEGFTVKQADDGYKALEILKNYSPKVIIMDVMMPNLDGIETCRKIRQLEEHKDAYIIFLTARSEEFTDIAAWEAGGNDYVIKPIKPRALVTRIQSVINSEGNQNATNSVLEILDLVIDKTNYTIKTPKETLFPTKKEFELLYFLASKPNVIRSREEILEKVWEEDTYILPRTIDVHVRKLRVNLGDHYIKTVKGLGYMFVV